MADKDLTKYSYFPVEYAVLERYYQRQKDVFWTPQEIDFSKDRADWDALDDGTRNALEFVLSLFVQFDGIVNENLIENFKRETSEYKEARNFYAAQEFIEVIHNETYSILIETLIRDSEKKSQMFNAIQTNPSVKRIADWVFEWMGSDRPLTERVIAFACVEGMFFSSAFALIYWIKNKKILPGLCKSNEFIARDEALHTEFAIALYHTLTSDESGKYPVLSDERIAQIIVGATETASEFTRATLCVDLVGMNATDMTSYVKCTANRLSESLGAKKLYEVENPFDWMAVIGLPNKSNFFETRVSEYARQSSEATDFKFDLTTDF